MSKKFDVNDSDCVATTNSICIHDDGYKCKYECDGYCYKSKDCLYKSEL